MVYIFKFQVSLNIDPVKEILKVRCQIYSSTMKLNTMRKIKVTMKTFPPPFFSHFSLSLNRKKQVVMRAMRKGLTCLPLLLSLLVNCHADSNFCKNIYLFQTLYSMK